MAYRVGIVGAGFGVRVHLPSYVAHPAFEVVALASPHSAAAAAAERKVPHAFDGIEAMLAGCELDVVSIATPPYAHHDGVLAALRAGKHVLCEKPFALNVAQAEAMVEAATRAGTACTIAHEFRYVPQRMAIRELIVNKHLDPLREIEITQLMGFLRADGDRRNNWWFDRKLGGGLA
ncbi:MAG: Gfo/Idh/MocA family oxidoreductase, partial [Candidatus Eremiobacteraeota bacterium]|nr:Gfo/Idh/MocA family oxidoreductase [Candidatus Eremiobacteraeota bacterium]